MMRYWKHIIKLITQGFYIHEIQESKYLMMAINLIQAGRIKYGVYNVWMNEDKELHERALATLMCLEKAII